MKKRLLSLLLVLVMLIGTVPFSAMAAEADDAGPLEIEEIVPEEEQEILAEEPEIIDEEPEELPEEPEAIVPEAPAEEPEDISEAPEDVFEDTDEPEVIVSNEDPGEAGGYATELLDYTGDIFQFIKNCRRRRI